MEAALVSGFIKIIVPRLFSLLSSEKYKLHKSVKGNVEFLQHELAMIARTIDDQISRGEHLNSARTQWIQELRQLAYEIEDCIDRYVYRLTCKQQASYMRGVTMKMADTQFASEMRKLREKVKEPSERMRRYTSESQWSTTAEPPAPLYDPHTEKADLVGIDMSQKELLELLEEGKGQLKQRKVISIVGFDGLGKTVLAEQVFHSDIVAEKFSPTAWIDVAQKDAKDVLSDIHSSLGLVDKPNGSVKLLSSEIEARLHNERYLIVIDDMRTEIWNTIGPAFPVNKGLNCRVIVTTPIQSVAKACTSDDRYVYKMRQLDEEHSLELFQRKGPKEEFDKTQILKKCDGIPLALVSIAQFMSKQGMPSEEATCQDLCNRLGYYLEMDTDTLARMQRVLTKNYTSLEGPDIKACLLYMGMFPSEHPIRRKRLIRRWLAEGFVKNDEKARMNFGELMNRNIIRPVDVSHKEKKVKTCRTCGMMVEFILRKSISQDFITVFSNGNAKRFCDQGDHTTCARHLCLHCMSKSNGSLGDVSLVRSLTVFGEAGHNLMELKKCELLRVLDLEECDDLKDISLKGISKLLLLKYLSLGETITLLPREIANLEFLQTLNIRRKNVTTLPVEVLLLPYLVHLLGKFRLTGKGKKMSKAEKILMSGESKLETLAGFIVDESQGFAPLMIHMEKLRKAKVWCDSTSSSAGIDHLSKAVQEFIKDKEDPANQSYRSLSLHFDHSPSDFLHSLEGSCYLSSLKLDGYLGRELPQFVSLLRGLRELCLSTSNLTANILAAMSKLCYLQYLKLIAEKLEEFVIEAGAFPKLLRLCLVLKHPTNNIPEIKEGALSKLAALQLLFEGLNGPSGINIAQLNSLREVTIHRDQTTKVGEWQRAAKDHPNRPSVDLLGMVHREETDVADNSTAQDEPREETDVADNSTAQDVPREETDVSDNSTVQDAPQEETDVADNSTAQDVKPAPETTVTQRPVQDRNSLSSRQGQHNELLNCRAEETKETCLGQQCSPNSTDLSNGASCANISRTTC